MVPEPIQELGIYNTDAFEGYAKERKELLKFIKTNGIRNVVFVAADIHGTVINDLSYPVGPGTAQLAVGAFEVVAGADAFDAPFGPTVLDLAADLHHMIMGQLEVVAGAIHVVVQEDENSVCDTVPQAVRAVDEMLRPHEEGHILQLEVEIMQPQVG
jgi:hypothetical protein